MSKYVNHKNGMILGSGNVFFITHDEDAPEGVDHFRDDYRAIVWAQGYHFDQISTLTAMIRTPVQQLLWARQEKKEYFEFEGKKYPRTKWYYVLKDWSQRWLNDNVGTIHKMWDVRTHAERDSECVFFKRRKDALAFIHAINDILKGTDKYDY